MAEINIINENIELILNKDEFRKLGAALCFAEVRLKELEGAVKNDEHREELKIFCKQLKEKIEAHLQFTNELRDIHDCFGKLILDVVIDNIEIDGRLRKAIKAIL